MRRTQSVRDFRRWLHARHSKGTARILNSLKFSPTVGLLLHDSPALKSVWAAGEKGAPPVARLARALFNRHEENEPLRPSRNKSHPAAHLTAHLQGSVLGLALRDELSEDALRSAMLELGVDVIARDTKVSIARFERLVALVRDASQSTQPLGSSDDQLETPIELCGVGVYLAYVWASARSKGCLLSFLTALQQHLDAPLFASDANPWCADWRASFEADQFGDEVQYMLGGGSRSIAPSDAELDALCNSGGSEDDQSLPADAFERLAYTLAARVGCAPEVAQEVHGYKGQPAIADCVEACCREALGLALWDRTNGMYDPSRLPSATDPRVTQFFEPNGGACATAEAGKVWFDLSSARPGLDYMLAVGSPGAYELFPSIENFAATFSSLLNVEITPPPELPAAGGEEEPPPLVPVWPGSALKWQRQGCARHPVLLFQRDTEVLRIVFNGQRHCYSLRDATAKEPAWLGRVRLAWKQRLQGAQPPGALRPEAHAAAARLLDLRGPSTRARHEVLHAERASCGGGLVV